MDNNIEDREANPAKTRRFMQRENAEAAKFIKDRMAIRSDIYREMLPEIRARAFTVVGMQDAVRIRKVQELLEKIPKGGSWREVRGEIAQELGGGESSKSRAEQIVRANVFQAYSVARYKKQLADKDIMPYLVYHAVGDENTRPEHKALDGMVLPVDDPFWKSHYPPWDYGCRCTVSGMTKSEADLLRGKKSGEENLQLMSQKQKDEIPPPSGGYSFDPSMMSLSVDGIRERIHNDTLLRKFAQKMQNEKVNGLDPEGKEDNVWNWLMRDQVKRDADYLRKTTDLETTASFLYETAINKTKRRLKKEGKTIPPDGILELGDIEKEWFENKTKKLSESVIIRDMDTGEKIAENSGSIDSSGADLMDRGSRRYVATHTHPEMVSAWPSADDLEMALSRNGMVHHIVGAFDSCTYRLADHRKSDIPILRAEMREKYRLWENGNISEDEWRVFLEKNFKFAYGDGNEGIE